MAVIRLSFLFLQHLQDIAMRRNGKDNGRQRRDPHHDGSGGARGGSAVPISVELLDTAEIPGGGALHLLRRGDEYSIQFDAEELMGSRDHLSEQALATMTCARLARTTGHVLIGGLGMGFTLGAALRSWTPASSFVVAELVPSIIDWAHGPLAHLVASHLADPRVSLRLADVYDEIRGIQDRYDAILLDVDNGPEALIKLENERLYCNWGLREIYTALRPNGALAVWSSFADDDFVKRLEQTGFAVDVIALPAFAGCEDRWHTLIFAAKPMVA